jgi:hypothetical protein
MVKDVVVRCGVLILPLAVAYAIVSLFFQPAMADVPLECTLASAIDH